MGCGSRPVLRCAHPRRHRRSRVGRHRSGARGDRDPAVAHPLGPPAVCGRAGPARLRAAQDTLGAELRPARTAMISPPLHGLRMDPEEETDARPFDQHASIFDVDVAGRVRGRPRPEPAASARRRRRAPARMAEGSSRPGGGTPARRAVWSTLARRSTRRARATSGRSIMGRNMFGGGPGPWGDDPWKGWWGDDPPFHMPVFVLTHHARAPLECAGGTTFTFVTDGPGRRSRPPAPRPGARASPSRVARASPSSTWRAASSTRSRFTSSRRSSERAYGCWPHRRPRRGAGAGARGRSPRCHAPHVPRQKRG